MAQDRSSVGAATDTSRTSRTIAAWLAISGAIVVAVATFLPWYQRGIGSVTRFGSNLYELSSFARWNPIAAVFVDAGAVLLLLSGFFVLLGRDHVGRPASAGMSIGVLAVIVGSVLVHGPRAFNENSLLGLFASVHVQRGPGLFVALTGAVLGVAALVVLVRTPQRREIHKDGPSTEVRAPVPS
jgi:hypothetical protein